MMCDEHTQSIEPALAAMRAPSMAAKRIPRGSHSRAASIAVCAS